jgi:hypothetical protein
MTRFGIAVVMAACVFATAPAALAQTSQRTTTPAVRQVRSLSLEVGLHWFKTSAGRPNELQSNAVFDRWESLNAESESQVRDYVPLKPLYFNMAFGIDALIRYRRHLMLKVGYDVTHPFGIGGYGHIDYQDAASGTRVHEEKSYSYTSHQLNTFLGPIVGLADNRADLYLGLSPMAPTWVFYREHYERTENGHVVRDETRHYRGFFGNCRALVGLQARLGDRFSLGSEAVFAFLNYMSLKSGTHTDDSFQFPFMQWHITARYLLF